MAAGCTLVEQGFTAPVFGMEGFLPFAAPAGTPRDILDKLSAAVREASATPQLKALRDQFGIPNVPVADLWQLNQWMARCERQHFHRFTSR